MGRNSIPKAIKDLRGTVQPCRDKNVVELPVIAKVPKAPKYFTKSQRVIFKNTCEQLVNLQLLTLVNIDLVAAYSREMGNYHDAEATIQRQHEKVKGTPFDVEESPYVTTRIGVNDTYAEIRALRKHSRESLKAAKELAKEFGFTPTSMGKLPGKSDSGADELLKFLGL